MKKYKLIKEYPSSPPKGTIMDINDHKEGYVLHKDGWYVPKDHFQDTKFWEPVEEKDYEILKLKGNNTSDIMDYTPFKNIGNGKIEFSIYSVRRLSDGEVFTVGDEVERDEWFGGELTKLEIKYDEMCAVIDDAWFCQINVLNHVKKLLFTTEDDVDIYEGDEYYHVHKDHMTICHNHNAYKPNGTDPDRTYFSTKEKAQEWIDLNKPRYSKQDILDALNSCRDSLYVTQVNFKKELGL